MASAEPIMTVLEHRLVIRERIAGDKITVECSMEGDGDALARTNPEWEASTGYLLLATAFQMFLDGSLWTGMHNRFGLTPAQVEIFTQKEEARPIA